MKRAAPGCWQASVVRPALCWRVDTIPKPDGLAWPRCGPSSNQNRTQRGRCAALCSLGSSQVRPPFEVRSAVGFAAITDGGDVEGVAAVVEAEPVVADAQAELGRLDVLEALHVALTGGGEVGQGAEKAQGSWLVNGAELWRVAHP